QTGRVPGPDITANQKRWSREVGDQLPKLLDELLSSEVYGLGENLELPPAKYGVYLFSQNGRPRYVGRVGLTERSRRAGKKFSNFQTRLKGHVAPRHSSGTYAYGRTVKLFRERGVPLADTRKGNTDNPAFM